MYIFKIWKKKNKTSSKNRKICQQQNTSLLPKRKNQVEIGGRRKINMYLAVFLMNLTFLRLVMGLVLVVLVVQTFLVHRLPDKTTSICFAYSAKTIGLFHPTGGNVLVREMDGEEMALDMVRKDGMEKANHHKFQFKWNGFTIIIIFVGLLSHRFIDKKEFESSKAYENVLYWT